MNDVPMLRKRDFERGLDFIQDQVSEWTQRRIDKTNELLSLEEGTWDKFKEMTEFAAENAIISGDVENEIDFILGETWNPHNGGWADRMNTSQKIIVACIMKTLHDLIIGHDEILVIEIVPNAIPFIMSMN
jgi:hypothetical protein